LIVFLPSQAAQQGFEIQKMVSDMDGQYAV